MDASSSRPGAWIRSSPTSLRARWRRAIPRSPTPIALQPHAEEIVASLEKVHASRNILCEFEIQAQARFYGEAGDLLELLGNLLENAFKWARHQVF